MAHLRYTDARRYQEKPLHICQPQMSPIVDMTATILVVRHRDNSLAVCDVQGTTPVFHSTVKP
jgi:hypothetical protein